MFLDYRGQSVCCCTYFTSKVYYVCMIKLRRCVASFTTGHLEGFMIFGMTFYQMLWYFLEYSFIGWVVEVVFHAVTMGKIINRGFLNGPVCPIYGTGMLGVLMISNLTSSALEKAGVTSGSVRQLCIFAGGSLFATIVELAGGWILDKLFHARWWDYSKRRFNLNGYICLEFSILWGLGILFVVEIVHPFLEVEPTHGIIAHTVGIVLLSVFYVVFAADVIVTVLTVRGFNQKLAEIDEISAAIHIGSDYITEKIGDRACKTTVKVEEGMLQAKLGCAELKDKVRSDKEDFETLTENRRRELIAKRNKLFDDLSGQFGIGRLLKAFPNAKHDKHAEVMKELVDKYIRGAL